MGLVIENLRIVYPQDIICLLRLSVVNEAKSKRKNWASVSGVIFKGISQMPPACVK